MKKSISISVNEEKLSAIEMYLEQKNTTLAAELDKYVDQLYGKIVPQNVRDFIDMMSAKSLRESRRILLLPNRKSNPSSNSPQFAPCRLVCRFHGMGGISLP